MIGTAREFLVKRVLRSVLPPAVHIGSGKIFGEGGRTSKQVDVILFDSRFPLFEVEAGIGLYPAEGVIATVEVKSTLTIRHLNNALDNILAALSLGARTETRPWHIRIRRMIEHGVDEGMAQRTVGYEWMPPAYIFAFSTHLSRGAIARAVYKWFTSKGMPSACDDMCAMLPRIIVAGRIVGLLDDGHLQIDPGQDVMERWRKENPSPIKHKMSFWAMPTRFGFLMHHLLFTVVNRAGLVHGASGSRYAVDQYLPGVTYAQQHIDGIEGTHIGWQQGD